MCLHTCVCVGPGLDGGMTVMNERQNGSVTHCALSDAQQAMIITVNVTISKENAILEDDHEYTLIFT